MTLYIVTAMSAEPYENNSWPVAVYSDKTVAEQIAEQKTQESRVDRKPYEDWHEAYDRVIAAAYADNPDTVHEVNAESILGPCPEYPEEGYIYYVSSAALELDTWMPAIWDAERKAAQDKYEAENPE